jgi:AraC-like DNA-binding protein
MPLVLPGEEVSLNEPGRMFARHHHLRGYAALIVSGSCDEAGDRGRFRASAGDVLVHLAFDAHQDHIGRAGAKIINFEVDELGGAAFGHVTDLDAIVRLHEKDPVGAGELLGEQFAPNSKPDRDWPDLLAEQLTRAEPMRLDRWAELHALNPSSLSRGFRQVYGVTPKRYRLEQMVSRAARSARDSGESLSMLAAASGFSDQSHMTRAMAQLFGITPNRLRHLG